MKVKVNMNSIPTTQKKSRTTRHPRVGRHLGKAGQARLHAQRPIAIDIAIAIAIAVHTACTSRVMALGQRHMVGQGRTVRVFERVQLAQNVAHRGRALGGFVVEAAHGQVTQGSHTRGRPCASAGILRTGWMRRR